MLSPAPLESARFDLRIFRADMQSLDVETLVSELIKDRVDVAILRLPARAASEIGKIAAYGLRPIHADTLAIYECCLQDREPKTLKNPPTLIQPAEPSDGPAIIDLIKAVFANYPNHYHANPLLDPKGALDGYCEWAMSHLHGSDRIAWVTRIGDRIAAIACSSFDHRQKICQGVLHGVHPDFSGNGYYTDLIRYTQHHFRNLGYRILKIATQIGNLPVQQVWGRENFSVSEVFDTFHVNSLLDRQHPDSSRSDLMFPESGRMDRGAALPWFLNAANEMIGEFWDAAATECAGMMLEAPARGRTYEVGVARYRCSNPVGSTIFSATIHDHNHRLCGIGQFRAKTNPKEGSAC